jgi:hypothetical protein
MKSLLKVIFVLIAMALFLHQVFTPPKYWWIKIGGVMGDNVHVRSEIVGVVQETNVVILTTLRVPVATQAVDYWITRTATNQDLWIEVFGPGGKSNHGIGINRGGYGDGWHVSIRKRQISVSKFRYGNQQNRQGDAGAD